MRCKEVQYRLSSYLLDELDLRERTEVDQHLEHCPACDHERAQSMAVLRHIKTQPEITTSAERREKALQSMRTAHQERSIRHKRFWLVLRVASVSLAASLIVAFLGTYYLVARPLPSHAYGLAPDRLVGRVMIQRQGDPTWTPLTMDQTVHEGDWLETDAESVSTFRLMDEQKKHPMGFVTLDVHTRIKLSADDHTGRIYLLLDHGDLRGTLSTPEATRLVLIAPDDDRAVLSRGTFEGGLRYMIPSTKATSPSPQEKASYKITREWIRLDDLLQWAYDVTGTRVVSLSPTLSQSYVSFYSNAVNDSDQRINPQQLLKDIGTELERQGLTLVREEGGQLKVLAFIRDPLGGNVRGKLYVRGLGSQAELVGAHGSIAVMPGQEAMVDYWGYPRIRENR